MDQERRAPEPVTIPQMERLWDFATGNTAQLAYLWTVDKFYDDGNVVMMANVIVALGVVPPGRYPHTLALQWVQEGFTTDQVRDLIRAGINEPEELRKQQQQAFAYQQQRRHLQVVDS